MCLLIASLIKIYPLSTGLSKNIGDWMLSCNILSSSFLLTPPAQSIPAGESYRQRNKQAKGRDSNPGEQDPLSGFPTVLEHAKDSGFNCVLCVASSFSCLISNFAAYLRAQHWMYEIPFFFLPEVHL